MKTNSAHLLILSIRIFHQYKRIPVGLLWHVALVVDKMVDRTRLGGVGAGEVFEIEAPLGKLLPTGKAFPIGIQFLQYVVVAGQDTVDFTDHIDLFVGLFVVVAVAARVAAKLLVHATDDGFTAVEAFSFFHRVISC